MNTSNLLFVYGSLKRGEVNFPVLVNAGARFLGAGMTRNSWPIEQGPLWRRLLDRPGVGEQVSGELFLVESEAGWQQLDEFEGHPHGYRRRLEEVIDHGEQVRLAWIYFYVSEWD